MGITVVPSAGDCLALLERTELPRLGWRAAFDRCSGAKARPVAADAQFSV
jgi:hypothetical protein